MNGGLANWAALGIVALFLFFAVSFYVEYFRAQHRVASSKPRPFRKLVGALIAAFIAEKAYDATKEQSARMGNSESAQNSSAANSYPNVKK